MARLSEWAADALVFSGLSSWRKTMRTMRAPMPTTAATTHAASTSQNHMRLAPELLADEGLRDFGVRGPFVETAPHEPDIEGGGGDNGNESIGGEQKHGGLREVQKKFRMASTTPTPRKIANSGPRMWRSAAIPQPTTPTVVSVTTSACVLTAFTRVESQRSCEGSSAERDARNVWLGRQESPERRGRAVGRFLDSLLCLPVDKAVSGNIPKLRRKSVTRFAVLPLLLWGGVAWASCPFSAGNYYQYTGGTPVTASDGKTVVAWAKVGNLAAGGAIFNSYASGNELVYFNVGLDVNEVPYAWVRSAGANDSAAAASAVTQNAWSFVHATFTSTTSRVAGHNGTNGTPNTTSITPASVNRITLGNRNPTSPLDPLVGSLAGVAVFSELDTTQLTALKSVDPTDYGTWATANSETLYANWDMRSSCPATLNSSVNTYPLTKVGTITANTGDNPTFAPSLTSGPTEGTNTSSTVQFTFTPSASGTVYWATIRPGASDYADCAAVQAASGAYESGSKAVTGADSVTVDFDRPAAKFNACISNGGGSSSVYNAGGVITRNAASGKQIVAINTTPSSTSPWVAHSDNTADATEDSNVLTGMSETSLLPFLSPGIPVTLSTAFSCGAYCGTKTVGVDTLDLYDPYTASMDATNLTASITPLSTALANEDYWEIATETSAGCPITPENDADIIIGTDGDCPNAGVYQTFAYNFQDASNAADFSELAAWPSYATYYLNGSPPTIEITPPNPFPSFFALFVGEPFAYSFVTNDPDGQAVTVVAMDSLPDDTEINGSNQFASDGPTTEDLDGWTFRLLAKDSGGRLSPPAVAVGYTFPVGGEIEMPDEVGEDSADAVADILDTQPWRLSFTSPGITTRYVCSQTEPAPALNEVVAQTPAAMETMLYTDDIRLDVSTGGVCGKASGAGGKGVNRLGMSPFL